MLKPNNSWTWYYDQKDDALMLDLGDDMVFRVAIPTKHLIPSSFAKATFTVDDATVYQTFLEGIACLELSGPRKVELALTAVAASRFHKPIMPKSWFFKKSEGDYQPRQADIVTLYTDSAKANYLVVENSGCASLCMLADVEPLALTSTKEMKFCDVIKVMNDRTEAYQYEEHITPLNFALVG
ncbi:cell division protein ZapC [Photobacterium makurazakiensis]|uniref:cell division protein ZapC n=1 Tax=Photobacterium makurazakiensis TaxID=2910234 RepID=UPI003D10D0E4